MQSDIQSVYNIHANIILHCLLDCVLDCVFCCIIYNMQTQSNVQSHIHDICNIIQLPNVLLDCVLNSVLRYILDCVLDCILEIIQRMGRGSMGGIIGNASTFVSVNNWTHVIFYFSELVLTFKTYLREDLFYNAMFWHCIDFRFLFIIITNKNGESYMYNNIHEYLRLDLVGVSNLTPTELNVCNKSCQKQTYYVLLIV